MKCAEQQRTHSERHITLHWITISCLSLTQNEYKNRLLEQKPVIGLKLSQLNAFHIIKIYFHMPFHLYYLTVFKARSEAGQSVCPFPRFYYTSNPETFRLKGLQPHAFSRRRQTTRCHLFTVSCLKFSRDCPSQANVKTKYFILQSILILSRHESLIPKSVSCSKFPIQAPLTLLTTDKTERIIK